MEREDIERPLQENRNTSPIEYDDFGLPIPPASVQGRDSFGLALLSNSDDLFSYSERLLKDINAKSNCRANS
ncbi:hypothetical protein Avbf_13207 [Armadillidium vulgare]|nr:hypothetical protein Avbf_13207 [Armadillidium vulgare]